MAILKTTTLGQLGKYVNPIVESLKKAINGGTPVQVGQKKFKLKKNKANIDAIKKFDVLGKKGATTQKQALSIELQTTDNDTQVIKIGQLDKPRVNLNFGDMSEGVVACAIAVRFMNKTQNITEADVFDMISRLSRKTPKNANGKSGKYVESKFESPNKNPNINDIVRLYISLADVNMSALLDPKNKKSLEEYVSSAVLFANSGNVMKWADILYNNNRFDRIEVISDGLGGQKTTKVDITVKVTNDKGDLVPVNINLSLKAGDVKQFGQVSGAEFEKQEELWEILFGYGAVIKPLKSKYDTLMFKNKKPEAAVSMVYHAVSNKLNRDLKGPNSAAIIKKLSDGINYFATLGEENVSLLQIGGGGATVYNFENVYSKLKGKKFKSRVETGQSNLPSLFVFLKDKDLIKFRVKQEFKNDGSAYIRNYIEKEKLFTELLGVKL
jgi:hypothetical protein